GSQWAHDYCHGRSDHHSPAGGRLRVARQLRPSRPVRRPPEPAHRLRRPRRGPRPQHGPPLSFADSTETAKAPTANGGRLSCVQTGPRTAQARSGSAHQFPPVSFSRSACSASSEASEPLVSSVLEEYDVASPASASACLASACCLTWASQRACALAY